jgi:hypothetical protein
MAEKLISRTVETTYDGNGNVVSTTVTEVTEPRGGTPRRTSDRCECGQEAFPDFDFCMTCAHF